jgi:hypothetical protein
MYACITKLQTDFSRACATSAARPLISATHPPLTIRELTPANASRSQRDGAGRVGRLPRPLDKVYGSGHKLVYVVVEAVVHAVDVL